MDYGACKACRDDGTRGSDAVAALIARMHPGNGEGSWQADDIRKLRSTIIARAPRVLEELCLPGKGSPEWARRPGSGLFRKFVRVRADGPRVKAHLSAFGAKLAMALYREHIGVPLPVDGAVWCQFRLNGGVTQEHLNEPVEKLPLGNTLRQGRRSVGEQFVYRYNCDERTVIAAVVQFHRGLWFIVFASSDKRLVELFRKPEFLQLPGSAMVRPGGLVSLCRPPLPSRLSVLPLTARG